MLFCIKESHLDGCTKLFINRRNYMTYGLKWEHSKQKIDGLYLESFKTPKLNHEKMGDMSTILDGLKEQSTVTMT